MTQPKGRVMSEAVTEIISFKRLVEIGLNDLNAHIVDGFPWSFKYRGYHVTHETDEDYIIGLGDQEVRLLDTDDHPNQFLAIRNDGRLLVFEHSQISDLEKLLATELGASEWKK